MKSAYGPPVIVDSDGEIRWAQSGTGSSATSILRNNGFDAFGTLDNAVKLSHLELDGTTSTIAQVQLASGNYTGFQHDIDRGEVGMLVMPDTASTARPTSRARLPKSATRASCSPNDAWPTSSGIT